MVKEIERYGLPIVHLATIISISQSVGANRIVPAIAIPHPAGDPDLKPETEKELRRELVEKSLEALTADIEEQTLFE